MASDVMPENVSKKIDKNCEYCNKIVKNFVKCKKCGGTFHPACLKQAAVLKNTTCVHEIDDHAGLTSKDADTEVTLLRTLVQELQSKNRILEENGALLREKIGFLEEKLKISEAEKAKFCESQLHSGNTGTLSAICPATHNTKQMSLSDPATSATTYASMASKPNTNPRKQNNKIHVQQVNAAVSQAQAAVKMQQIQDLGKTDMNIGNKTTGRYGGRSRKFMIGNNDQTQEVQAIPKLVSLHVTRLKPDTTPEALKALLEPHFPGVECSLHPAKYPASYSSFKVTINQEQFKAAWRSEIWPSGSVVSRFLTKRRVPSQLTDSLDPQPT